MMNAEGVERMFGQHDSRRHRSRGSDRYSRDGAKDSHDWSRRPSPEIKSRGFDFQSPRDRFIVDENAPRETGVVLVVKEQYGFIRCAQRNEKMFFHFSEFGDSSGRVERGDEVEFAVAYDEVSNRTSAVNIVILPQGSVCFETVSEHLSEGVVQEALHYAGSKARSTSEPYGAKIIVAREDVPDLSDGGIVASLEDPQSVILEFSGRDVHAESVEPLAGDRVQFRLFTESRTGRQGATNITVVGRQGSTKISSVDRQERTEHGTIASLKDSYGFIKCFDLEQKQLFFHFSEVKNRDSTPSLNVGSEVAFVVAKNHRGKPHATSITILPTGTIQLSVVSAREFHGVVVKGVAPNRKHRERQEVGQIRPFIDEAEQLIDAMARSIDQLVLTTIESEGLQPGAPGEDFGDSSSNKALITAETLQPPTDRLLRFVSPGFNIRVFPGDEVSFRVIFNKKTGEYDATEVKILTFCPTGRCRGVITLANADFGFAASDDPAIGSQYFHKKQFVDKTYVPKKGDEVEYDVVSEDMSKSYMARIVVLPKGTVGALARSELTLRGAVFKAPGAISTGARWNSTKADKDVALGLIRPDPDAVENLRDLVAKSDSEFVASSSSPGCFANLSDESGCEEYMVRFVASSSLTKRKASYRVGDIVEFKVTLHEFPLTTSFVKFVPVRGVVDTVASGSGTIKLDSGEQVSFSNRDVVSIEFLRLGDVVSVGFMTDMPSLMHPNGRAARSVTCVQQYVPIDDSELVQTSKEVQLDDADDGKKPRGTQLHRHVVRMARGPDRTGGFGAGRGRPLEGEDEPLLLGVSQGTQ